MLIKKQIEEVVLNQLKKIDINLSEIKVDFTVDWDSDRDTFIGTIYVNSSNYYYDYCVDLTNNIFEVVWIKKIETQHTQKIIYSIDRKNNDTE